MTFSEAFFDIVLPFIGGLGLFLLGMKLMSENLESVAGASLRKLMDLLTKNRFLGVLVGALFTMVVQSSSATTVMVVGLVNAGLMSLVQAAGVIMGANIGTTITAQMIAFNLSDWAPAFLFAGVVLLIFFSNKKINRIGLLVVGFGALFLGMGAMSSAMKPLRELEAFRHIIANLENPLLGILVGVVVTSIIQSSSASLGILQAMAGQGLVTLGMSVYVVLGMNIGTCVTALIASIGVNKNAKRAAVLHLIFNILLSAIMGLMIQFLPIVSWVEDLSGANAMRQIANAHSLFNIMAVVLIFPLAGWLVKIAEAIIPGKDEGVQPLRMEFVDEHVFATPPIAVAQVVREVWRMAQLARNSIDAAVQAYIRQDAALVAQVFNYERVIDYLNHEITHTLVRINQLQITNEDRVLVGSLFHVVNDLERIGDHAENIAEFAEARIEDHIPFSEAADQEVEAFYARVKELLDTSLEVYDRREYSRARTEIEPAEEQIDIMERALRNAHIDRLNASQCTPHSGMIFIETLSNLERVADHATNIAYSILDES